MAERPFDMDEPRFKHGLTMGEMPVVGRVWFTTADRLAEYEKRGVISEEQWRAGNDFASDYERAISGASTTCAYERRDPTHGGHQESELRAAERWRHARDTLGPIGADIAVRVCCEGMSAKDWAHGRGERREYGIGRLREALDVLIACYP